MPPHFETTMLYMIESREKEFAIKIYEQPLHCRLLVVLSTFVCMRVCVCERERERKRETAQYKIVKTIE